ncbi:unnamed protein product, partial [Staurois parvus]
QRCNQTRSLHYLDIENITASQSGEYLCFVFFLDKGVYKWKRVNKTVIQVTNGETKPTDRISSIVLGTIGGLVAVGAILCLMILCIKYKGKQRRANHSHSNTLPT